MIARRAPLVVLLGGDYCGKSSVMRALRAQSTWGLVSCDDDFLPEAYRSIARLRDVFFQEVLPHVKQMPTQEFALLGLQMSTVYLRDWASALRERGPVLVDSYYYKLLAKCTCAAWACAGALAAFRDYPQPDEVIYLDVSPEVALERARARGGHNQFEAMGSKTRHDEAAFVAFQAQMARAMRDATSRVPTTVIDANQRLDDVIRGVRERLEGACSP
jgi:thymidylate kinase